MSLLKISKMVPCTSTILHFPPNLFFLLLLLLPNELSTLGSVKSLAGRRVKSLGKGYSFSFVRAYKGKGWKKYRAWFQGDIVGGRRKLGKREEGRCLKVTEEEYAIETISGGTWTKIEKLLTAKFFFFWFSLNPAPVSCSTLLSADEKYRHLKFITLLALVDWRLDANQTTFTLGIPKARFSLTLVTYNQIEIL